MKTKINSFLDLFPNFDNMSQSEQIVWVTFFHTVEEGRESINKADLQQLFRFAALPVPINPSQMLHYLASEKEPRLVKLGNDGEYGVSRATRKKIQSEVDRVRGTFTPPVMDTASPFNFGDRKFTDTKVAALLAEIHRCYTQHCWNACGILVRIVIERTLDTVDPVAKAKVGLKDKINVCRGLPVLSKSLRESLDHLQNAKIIGDIAAHHSKVILDKPDIELVLPAFRMLVKEVQTV